MSSAEASQPSIPEQLAAAGPRLARVGVVLPEHQLDTSGRELYAMLEAQLGNVS